VREELGLNPEDLVSPIGAMISSFLSFCIGAVVPLLPFLWPNQHNLLISVSITALTLFCIGMILSLFSNRHPFLSGCRMLFVGAVAGGVTYLIGHVLGISLY
jgi:vacuolar iron transporter family protein